MNIASTLDAGRRAHPDRPALIVQGCAVSYRELELGSRRVAAALSALEIRRGDRVALLLPNGRAFVETYLAVLRLGAIAVSLNPDLGSEELGRLLADCSARAVVATGEGAARIPRHELPELAHLLVTGGGAGRSLDALLPEDPPELPAAVMERDQPAAIVYTSGTTGEPKGATLSHGNVLSNMAAKRRLLGIRPEDRLLLFLPLFHCFGQNAVMNAGLGAGATLVLHSRFDLGEVLRSIARDRVTMLFGIPTTFRLLLEGARPEDLEPVRYAFSAATTLPREVERRFRERFGLVVHQGYGLTETSPFASYNHSQAPREGSLGTPIEGVEMKVVDLETGDELPDGESGEIAIRGPNVMLGYWGKPEATAEAIRDGWFYTGDIGHRDADGYFFLDDRLKDMVSVGGLKVWPAEVENVLLSLAGVADAAVYAVPEALLGERVAADVVPRAGHTLRSRELIAGCRGRLAPYKVPATVRIVESIPRSPSGKILKRVLRQQAGREALIREAPIGEAPIRETPVREGSPRGGGPQPPAGAEAQEGESARICSWLERWLADALGRAPAAGVSFFDLGLDSARAVTLAAELEAFLGRPVSAAALWRYTTPRALAGYLAGAEEPVPQASAAVSAHPAVVREPIAIVGIGCRFPGGARDPESFWRLLSEGRDAVTEAPARRLDLEHLYHPDPERPGRTYCRHGAFLEEVDRFDPAFFGIAPREAEALDPQQRLLLEVAWEALENAGIPADRLGGSATGVFTGLSTDDWSRRAFTSGDLEAVDAYSCLGNLRSLAAGRLSYTFDLKGPSLQLDTACSSSLVAVHLACLALRAGQCELALAGGVNLMLAPESTLGVAKLRGLSASGRCHAFDAAADGYVRGEGCGLVVLKRLSDARRDGDLVRAVILGSAINHDGRSNGITAPSGGAQAAVIRAALADAGVEPEAVRYVETHGTGTQLGDPVEAAALGEVFGPRRGEGSPLWIGSVKTNLGHLEAAAGVAGLLKTALALEQEEIPPSLHFHTPNPHVPWDALPLAVPVAPTPWAAGPRLAGVSSFGMSGTNAHLVLAAAEPEGRRRAGAAGDGAPVLPCLVCLSARDEAALERLARRHRDHLRAHPELSLEDVAFTLAVGRSQLPCRFAAVARDLEELQNQLGVLVDGGSAPGTVRGRAGPEVPAVAFLFSGQGAQRPATGRELYAVAGTFRRVLDRCAQVLRGRLPWPLLEVLFAEGEGARQQLADTAVTQPALFALEVALCAQWRAWGVEPSALLGYSVGELAAACAAGVFSLEDGLELVAERARLASALPDRGAMATVEASEEVLNGLLASFLDAIPGSGEVTVSARLGSARSVVAGPVGALERVLEALSRKGVGSRLLEVSQAFHCPGVEPMLKDLRRAAGAIAMHPPHLPVIAGATGTWAGEEMAAADHWVRQIRSPVDLPKGIETLLAGAGGAPPGVLIEIGPGSGLLSLVRGLDGAGRVETLPSLRPGRGEVETLLAALGRLWVRGYPVDLPALWQGRRARRRSLPAYPFERQRFWLPAPQGKVRQPEEGSGRWLELPGLSQAVFASVLDPRAYPELGEHRVGGQAVAPAGWVLALLQACGPGPGSRPAPGSAPPGWALEEVVFTRPLACGLGEAKRTLHLVVDPPSEGQRPFEWLSFVEGAGDPAISHGSGRFVPLEPASRRTGEPEDSLDLRDIRDRCRRRLAGEQRYRWLAARGIEVAGSLRRLESARVGEGEALGRIQLPGAGEKGSGALDAGTLDACFQVMALASGEGREDREEKGKARLPFRVGRLEVRGGVPVGSAILCHARLREAGAAVLGDLTLCDEEGRCFASIEDLEARPLPEGGEARSSARAPAVYRFAWSEAPPPPDGNRPPDPVLLIASARGGADEIENALRAAGHQVRTMPPEGLAEPALEAEGLRTEVVYVAGSHAGGGADPAAAAAWECRNLVSLVQALARRGAGSSMQPLALRVVTRGAQAVRAGEAVDPAAAALWGLGRVIPLEGASSEEGSLTLRLVDLGPGEAVRAEEVLGGDGEEAVAWRGGRRWRPRLVEETPAGKRGEEGELELDPRGVYLITGGLGSVGLELAAYLAGAGARHLVLAGRRSEPVGPAVAAIASLEAQGVTVRRVACDVADAGSVEALVARISEAGPLRGIVHAAGVVEDGLLLRLTPERLERVLAPKVAGAWNLHRASRGQALDFFLCCSSAAAVLGSPGQGAYAAANAFLGGLCALRSAEGLPALAVDWGFWDGSTMVASLGETARRRWEAAGVGSLSPASALAPLPALLEDGRPQAAVLAMDWRTYLRRGPHRSVPRALSELAPGEGSPPPEVSSGRGRTDLRRQLQELPRGAAGALLAAYLRDSLAAVSGLGREEAVPGRANLFELGLDSLMAVELKSRFEADLAVPLPATLVFDRPTLAGIEAHLAGKIFAAAETLPAAETPVGLKEIYSGAAQRLVELSEEEVEARLLEKLARLDR